MIKEIKIEFNDNEIKAEEFATLLEDNIIPGYFTDSPSNSIEKNIITIGETYELGDIDDGLLEEALGKIADHFPESVIKVSGYGDDAGSLWRFIAECSKGDLNIKKSDYFKMVLIGDYEESDYQNFIEWGNGKGMTREDFEKYKKDGVKILYRPEDGPDAFYTNIPTE